MNRWHVVAWYRSAMGLIDVHHHIEEIEDLHDLIERGPSWQALEKIEITYCAMPHVAGITIEEAEKQ